MSSTMGMDPLGMNDGAEAPRSPGADEEAADEEADLFAFMLGDEEDDEWRSPFGAPAWASRSDAS